jgi:hypothetical protein
VGNTLFRNSGNHPFLRINISTMTTMHSTPTATSTRSYSVLRFLLLLGSYSHLPSLADAVVAPLSQQCFTTRQELADALYDICVMITRTLPQAAALKHGASPIYRHKMILVICAWKRN